MGTNKGWIGVDLDGTLAEYNGWLGPHHIGEPIPKMVERVVKWREAGMNVKIVTARCAAGEVGVVTAIEAWCINNLGFALPVTCQKDYGMIELWDDRCVQVIPNTGMRADGKDD